jgi:hypothetical protein
MYVRRHIRKKPAIHLRLGASLIVLLIEGLLVVQASRAAFSDTTVNTTSSFSTVDLVDDDTGSAMFSITNIVPGQSVTKCIVVTYQGMVANPAAVKLFSGGDTNTCTLGRHLNVTVEEGTGGSFSSCNGFITEKVIVNAVTLSTFNTTYNNYSTGAGVWDPSATPESKTYKVTVQLDSTTPECGTGQIGERPRLHLGSAELGGPRLVWRLG